MLNDLKRITPAMNENIRYLCKYRKLEILQLKMLILEQKIHWIGLRETEIKGSVSLKMYY